MFNNKNMQDNPPPEIIENVNDTFLCSYPIASAEMRYNEICSRDIFLRSDPEFCLFIRGEFSGCEKGGFADLNQIFLEFAMSCEGCKDQGITEESVVKFGEQLGKILVTTLYKDKPDIPSIDKISTTFTCVLKSMSLPYTVVPASDKLHYILPYCPIHQTAKKNGLTRGIAMAHRTFIALCTSIIQNLSPNWVLLNPTEADMDNPLHEIVVSRLK